MRKTNTAKQKRLYEREMAATMSLHSAIIVSDKDGRWRLPGGTHTTSHVYAKGVLERMAQMIKTIERGRAWRTS
jgi:hypothetical protein